MVLSKVSWVVERKMTGTAQRRTRGGEGVSRRVDCWGVAAISSLEVGTHVVAADVAHVAEPVKPLHVVVKTLEGPSWFHLEAAASGLPEHRAGVFIKSSFSWPGPSGCVRIFWGLNRWRSLKFEIKK